MGKVKGNVIALYTQKGGVAKTTSTIAFANILSLLGKDVLIVDLDSQGNCSTVFRVDNEEDEGGLYKMICLDQPTENLIVKSEVAFVDLIPAGYRRIDAADYLTCKKHDPNVLPFEWIGVLKKKLNEIESRYDYIFIDCSPSEDSLSECALAAATDVISPVVSDKFSHGGIRWIYNKIQNVRERYNPDLNFVGTLMVKVSQRGKSFKRFHKCYIEDLGEDAIWQPIRTDQELPDCNDDEIPMFNIMRRSRAKGDYIKAACEIGLIKMKDAERLLSRFAVKGEEKFEYMKGGE